MGIFRNQETDSNQMPDSIDIMLPSDAELRNIIPTEENHSRERQYAAFLNPRGRDAFYAMGDVEMPEYQGI